MKKLKLFGPEQVTINGEIYNLNEILSRKKEKLKEGESIIEAKMRIYVTGDIPHANLENYLQRFMDYKIKTIDMSSWINLDKRHVSEGVVEVLCMGEFQKRILKVPILLQ